MNKWFNNAVFYHIYPLGMCGAPQRNDFNSQAVSRINEIYKWIPHMKSIGVNALYIGPVFESTAHGYDTADYFKIDRRLGTNEDMKSLSNELHRNGIKIVFDGVFNHCGRDFFAFRDLQKNKWDSPYKDWFANIDFSKHNHYGDAFCYSGWNGCFDLIKYNLKNNEIKDHLLAAVSFWIDEFNIDGIRLDAADSIDFDFFRLLRQHVLSKKDDFWLMGEVVHGDYSRWANDNMLHATTNYECYKGLYSSMNELNMFEVGYSLSRQFGSSGIYKNLKLYNFADNHDVNRIASTLKDHAKLYPLYLLLFTMPGIPSIYYGSEFGVEGVKINGNDSQLRPHLNIDDLIANTGNHDLKSAITRFAEIRHSLQSLRHGTYKQILINNKYLAFERECGQERVLVLINIDSEPTTVKIDSFMGMKGYDMLNNNELVNSSTLNVSGNWGRVIKLEQK